MTGSGLKEVIFSIGSNCGDREANVREGIDWLKGILLDPSSSGIYATPDCHGGQREYINAVVKGMSTQSIDEMESRCKTFELEHGRTPEARAAGNVPVDIDIVVFDGNTVRTKDFASSFFRIGYDSLR